MLYHRGFLFPGFLSFEGAASVCRTRSRKAKAVDAQSDISQRDFRKTAGSDLVAKDSNGEIGKRTGGRLGASSGSRAAKGRAQVHVEDIKAAVSASETNVTETMRIPVKTGRGRPRQKPAEDPPTELIFKLERRGDGWGEEIIPHLTVENRPIEPAGKARRAAAREYDSGEEEEYDDESGGLELYLIEAGVPSSEIDRLVNTAVAWRVTPGGRPLIDRRRQSRLVRNVRIVAEYLQVECGVHFGPNGVGAVFAQVPELMLCKPTSNDRWDRRAVELAAFRLHNGHCNVPENWEVNMELGIWVKRQRVARAAGQLSIERLKILERMGFEFGDLAQVTEEWEVKFDQLIDWMLWHGENRQTFSWVGIDWGERGGITARELALWMALQREFRERQLLPSEAIQRFEALHVEWEADSAKAEKAEQWMKWLGRLVYAVEKKCRSPSQGRSVPQGRGKVALRRRATDEASSPDTGATTTSSSSSSSNRNYHEYGDGDNIEASNAANSNDRRGGASSTATGHAPHARLGAVVAARRQAVAAGSLTDIPGLSFWVARQRWLWRQGRLSTELVRMLFLAGVDMDLYSPTEWQLAAHQAANVVQGSKVTLNVKKDVFHPLPPSPQPKKEEVAQHVALSPLPSKPQRGRPKRQQPPPAPPAHSPPPPVEPAAKAATVTRLPLPRDTCEPSRGIGSLKLRTRRWVQTQRALFVDGRLSPGQQRYMALLGITWLLSDEVVAMRDGPWKQRAEELAHECLFPEDPSLQEWLQHQRGLRALGLLSAARCQELDALGVQWQFDRLEDADDWDLRLSQLLVQNIEDGGLKNVTAEGEKFKGLAAWLAVQKERAAVGELERGRAAQLKALGVDAAGPQKYY